MRRFILGVCLVAAWTACNKDIKTEDVISKLSIGGTQIVADGQSTIPVSVQVSQKASSDRLNVIFSTTAGVFTDSGTTKLTAKAEFENGILLAKVTLRAPQSPGLVKISVQPEFDSPLSEFMLTDSIPAVLSEAATIKLATASYGIASNFLNEVKLTATLKNASGKFVSEGYKVLFEDILLSGAKANGRFRELQTATVDSGRVSGYYAAAAYPVGTDIRIRATLLRTSGERTDTTDAITLTINQ